MITCKVISRASAVYGLIFALVSSAVFAQPTVRWTFDEPAGGTVNALDSGVGTPADGVLGSTATRTTDTPGGTSDFALDLSTAGLGSIIDAGNPIKVDTLSLMTFSTWVKLTGATWNHPGGGNFMRLIAKQGTGTAAGFSFQLGAPSTGGNLSTAFRPGLVIGGATGIANLASSADILNRDGDWLFLAATYDSTLTSNNVKFYIGDETTAVAQLGTSLSTAVGAVKSTNTSNGGTGNAPLAIGYTQNNPTGDHGVNGYQDDARIYTAVLDASSLDLIRLENLQAPSVLGDYNDNGSVDAADYVLWRKGGPLENEADAPGTVNAADYTEWSARFGNAGSGVGSGSGATGSASAVPEPASAVLLLAALAAAALRRRACK